MTNHEIENPLDPTGMSSYVDNIFSNHIPLWKDNLVNGVYVYEGGHSGNLFDVTVYDKDNNGITESVSILDPNGAGYINLFDRDQNGFFEEATQVFSTDFDKTGSKDSYIVHYLSTKDDNAYDNVVINVNTGKFWDPTITLIDLEDNGKFDDFYEDGFWFFDTPKSISDGSLTEEFKILLTPRDIYNQIQLVKRN